MSQMGMSQNLRTTSSKTSYERAYLAFFWVNIHKPQLFWCESEGIPWVSLTQFAMAKNDSGRI